MNKRLLAERKAPLGDKNHCSTSGDILYSKLCVRTYLHNTSCSRLWNLYS